MTPLAFILAELAQTVLGPAEPADTIVFDQRGPLYPSLIGVPVPDDRPHNRRG